MIKSERFNSMSHLVGAVLALAGAVVLVVVASRGGDTRRIVSFSIYGATLFLLYLISTLYHGLPTGRAKHVFHVLDHQAIYLLIAGSYTPFTLVTLDGSVGWWLFGAIWGMAVLGLVLDALPRTGFIWLLTGGLLYTSGIVFFALDHRYPWMHGMWHLFVLAGSISHYVAILVYA